VITTPAVLSAFTTAIAAPSDSLSERFAATFALFKGFSIANQNLLPSTSAFCSPSFLHLFLIYLRLQQLSCHMLFVLGCKNSNLNQIPFYQIINVLFYNFFVEFEFKI
jgi:hypothetical protein